MTVFSSIAVELRRELPAFLFEENRKDLLNKYGEEQTPLDIVANDIFRNASINSGLVRRYYSEEEKEVVHGLAGASYTVTFDPLDGFSNIESSGPLGTIISIYKKNFENQIVTGRDIVASMFVIYGSTLAILFAAKDEKSGKMGKLQKFVNYKMDDGRKKFLRLKDDVKVSGKPGFFGFGGKPSSWNDNFVQFYNMMNNANVRVHGCFVAELFEIATPKGSVFAYTANSESPNGKLRFLVEGLPAAALLYAGGGDGWNFDLNYDSILDVPITSKNIDGRSPIIVGSKEIIEKAKDIYRHGS